MSTTETEEGVYILGGEGSHRGFFGAGISKGRAFGIIAIIGGTFVLVPAFGWVALVIGAAALGVVVLATTGTHNGTLIERSRRRRRFKESGNDRFVPYDAERWTMLTHALEQTRKTRDKGERAARIEWARELRAMRPNPDGADGMGWLESARGVPGIAWHGPVGETPYLSVAFHVSGQLRGMESAENVVKGAESFGRLLAGRAAPSSLLRVVQPITRVLPADTALQEFWVSSNIDELAPQRAKDSYEEVLRETGRGGMVQRHYVVGRWPITPRFVEQARKYGKGRDGWRALMTEEIASFQRSLIEARNAFAEPLTARGTVAVMRHMQNPSRPLDLVRDIMPTDTGERTRGGEFSAHVVEGHDPESGQPVEWWHRTAVIRAENLAVAHRRPLWLLDLLVGRELDVVRTVSFHIELVPAAEARHAARRDLVSDLAKAHAETAGGKIPLDESDVQAEAAQRRRNDLATGSYHHGANWIGYVTITAEDRSQLAAASRQLAELCSNSVGITKLEWLDSYQPAASGTTWPIARGLQPHKAAFSASIMNALAGRGEKEAIE